MYSKKRSYCQYKTPTPQFLRSPKLNLFSLATCLWNPNHSEVNLISLTRLRVSQSPRCSVPTLTYTWWRRSRRRRGRGRQGRRKKWSWRKRILLFRVRRNGKRRKLHLALEHRRREVRRRNESNNLEKTRINHRTIHLTKHLLIQFVNLPNLTIYT